MSRNKAIQNVNENVKKWDQAISDAQTLLERAENRAARLVGAIKTFTELRDANHPFTGTDSVKKV